MHMVAEASSGCTQHGKHEGHYESLGTAPKNYVRVFDPGGLNKKEGKGEGAKGWNMIQTSSPCKNEF